MKRALYIAMTVLLAACTSDRDIEGSASGQPTDARELTGIRAVVAGTEGTMRAGTVTRLVNYVGRNKFITNDKIVFTNICRTASPQTNFTYPGSGGYEGITFEFGTESAWSRLIIAVKEPERVYWTDAQSPHTFIAYCTPQTTGYDWKKYYHTTGSTKTYYLGSLGDPTKTGGDNDIIDFNNPEDPKDSTALANEDLLIAYDTNMQAEPGGSVALVKFYHALSSVRVVVNISGFASTSTAEDVKTVVSDMRLLHQPTMYVWKQENAGAQPLNAESPTVTDQQMVHAAWEGESTIPQYDQRKTLKLWIPNPNGTGSNQSKTFTFYGITTPQPENYLTLVDDKYKKTELEFKVTYPDPLKPKTETITETYKAEISNVYYEPGYNTTINISLNHKDEKMTVGAEYENWQFVATPDVGQLRKNSTFLQSTERTDVTIIGDKKATIDDATWLYEMDDTDNPGQKIIYDIYGHKGNTKEDAYQISTAYQLLSFAYEVKGDNDRAGRDFAGKFIRLDADLTLQKSSTKTREELIPDANNTVDNSVALALEWIGIGDKTHAFNGTFLGGNRFIYRLKGKPLFVNLGSNAKIEQLQVQPISIGNGSYVAISGNGLFAESNAGKIWGCRAVGDVTLDGTAAGAFVGSNSGSIYASYHIGDTKSTGAAAVVGGLVGSNTGTIASCYHAGVVGGTTKKGIAGNSTGTIDNTYFNNSLFTYDGISSGVIGKTSAEMTKESFVTTTLNTGIATWRTTHTDYDDYEYVYQPANYPSVQKK